MTRLIMIAAIAISLSAFAAELSAFTGEQVQAQVPEEAIAAAEEFFALLKPELSAKWEQYMIESHQVDFATATLASSFRMLILKPNSTLRWMKSVDLDPEPYSDITHYYFPVVSEGVVLLAIKVLRDANPESPEFGKWRAGGFAPEGTGFVKRYVRAKEVSADGSWIDIVHFMEAPSGTQVLIRDPQGSVMTLNAVGHPISLSSAAESWRDEYQEYELMREKSQQTR